jgi:hypothetical protein
MGSRLLKYYFLGRSTVAACSELFEPSHYYLMTTYTRILYASLWNFASNLLR